MSKSVHVYVLLQEVNGLAAGTYLDRNPEDTTCSFFRVTGTQGEYFYVPPSKLRYVHTVQYKEVKTNMILPTDAQERKGIPITTGVLDYFPLAIAEVAKCSWAGNQQHHPDSPLHWDKTKSTDHADCISRHLVDRGKFDSDGKRHSAKLAWRALALLQIELEEDLKKGKRDD